MKSRAKQDAEDTRNLLKMVNNDIDWGGSIGTWQFRIEHMPRKNPHDGKGVSNVF